MLPSLSRQNQSLRSKRRAVRATSWILGSLGSLPLILVSSCRTPETVDETSEGENEVEPCTGWGCEVVEDCVGVGCVSDPGGTGGTMTQSPDDNTVIGNADITFSPPSGTFEGSVAVTLAASRSDAEIRYTLDGSEPTSSSQLWDGVALTLAQTTRIRARVYVNGAPLGEEALGLYLARAYDQVHDLPVMVLDAYGAGAPDREYRDVAVLTYEGAQNSLSDTPTFVSHAGFHLRGQSTATFEKPPYRLELRNALNEDRDAPLLGMTADSDWALRGPFADKALIRDAFFYGLGADMGIASPRFRHVELYRNVDDTPLSQEDYFGVYLLVETIKNSKSRLDLKQLEEDDLASEMLSGGYIFKFEWLAAEEPILECPGSENCWNDLEVFDPVPLAVEQENWLASHLRSFVDVLYSPTFTDPQSGYQAFIDPDSFVDQIIINELGREMDSYIRSAYFHKDRDGKIFAGPLWDYNLSLDNGGFFENRETAGWQYEQERMPIANDWMNRLLEDPAFQARLNARWQTLRGTLLSDAALLERIDNLTAPLVNAAARNFERWPNLSDAMVGPFNTPTMPTWQGQVDNIKTWVVARAAWLDSQWQ